MMKKLKTIAAILLAFSLATASNDQTQIRRFLLSAGANNGGNDKILLRYAVSDARAFANVLVDMGGVERRNAIVLADPNSRELLGGIENLERLIANSRGRNIRNEVFIYYSGHADIDGLKLGDETLSWSDFRNAVNGLDAEVRVAVLDACGSGAITRTRGGTARPTFLSDASMNMKGYAFLTSSNENEASQESDRIRGGYFTHALLSGLRGAADMTGDGRVTINEAYQFAFNETLRSTQNTIAGTQHPSRDMNLAGTGDIVMTDLSRTNAILSLGEDIEGRFFIRDASGNLVAELHKPRGRPIELGMPAGKYSVLMEAPSRVWLADNVVISDGGRTVLSMNDMRAVERRVTTRRGEGVDGEGGIDDGIGDDIYDGVDDGNVVVNKVIGAINVAVNTIIDAIDDAGVSTSINNNERKSGDNPLLDSARAAPFRFRGNLFLMSDRPDNGVQLSFIGNMAQAEFVGTQVALGLNVARKDMEGLQLSVGFNSALEKFYGAQVAAGLNIAQEINGMQITNGLNIAHRLKGVQVGVINMVSDSLDGVQGGVMNIAGSVDYVQGGVMNIAGSVGYVQGGVMNIARSVGYVQGGVLNIANDGGNIQAGVMNIAGRVGRPIGIFNIAKYSERTPIGLFNFIGNGIINAAFHVDELGRAGVELQTGTPWLYTLLEYSVPIRDRFDLNDNTSVWGLGTRFGMSGPFYLNLDFAISNVNYHGDVDWKRAANDKDYVDELKSESGYEWYHDGGGRIRFGANYRFLPVMSVNVGASLNIFTESRDGSFVVSPTNDRYYHEASHQGRNARIWPGYYAGVTVGKF